MTDGKKERLRAYQRAYQRYRRSGDKAHMDRFFAKWGKKSPSSNAAGRGRRRSSLLGQRFGQWVAIEDTHKTTDAGYSVWICRNVKTNGIAEYTSKTLYDLRYQQKNGQKARTKAVGISIEHHARLIAIKKRTGSTASAIVESLIDKAFNKITSDVR